MRVSRVVFLCLALLLPASLHAQDARDYGRLTLSYRPATAQVFIDGERWVTPEGSGPLSIQLAPGPHTVEVRAPGYRPFSTTVEVRRGESTPVNVILPPGPAAPDFTPQPPRQGPPPIQGGGPVHQVSRRPSGDGFAFAPDFKITEMNHRTTGFGGFYAGAVFAGQFLIGGGAYFQLDDYNSEQVVYGGLVSEWRLLHDGPVGVTLHGLAGWGTTNAYSHYGYGHGGYVDPRHGGYYGYGPYYGVYEGFAVGEPEVRVMARLGSSARLVAGVGYRFTSADFYDLNGVTGNIAIQFGK